MQRKNNLLIRNREGDMMEENIEIIEDDDYRVIIDYENMTTTFEVLEDGL